MLQLYTEFEQATAEALAYYRNKDEPTERDKQDAVEMSCRWNEQRKEVGLRPFS